MHYGMASDFYHHFLKVLSFRRAGGAVLEALATRDALKANTGLTTPEVSLLVHQPPDFSSCI